MLSVMTVLVGLLTMFLGGNYVIYNLVGISMKPTYSDGDMVVLDKTKEVHRGDVIIFNFEGGEDDLEYNGTYVKRVVGLPGDILSTNQEGRLEINGKVYKNPETSEEVNVTVDKTVEVPDNRYYVVGDNGDNSLDSRVFGYVSKEYIVGVTTSIHIKGK